MGLAPRSSPADRKGVISQGAFGVAETGAG